MGHDFNILLPRDGTNALALDGYEKYLFSPGSEPLTLDIAPEDIIQMWVADMQFSAPQAALDAMADRLRHPIFGYTMNLDDQLYDAFRGWCERRYGWSFPREQMMVSLGVIPALFALIHYLCGSDDKVLTLSPSYGYFKHAAVKSGRTFITSPLVAQDGHYEVDFADFEKNASDPAVKVFFLCHPHNPTGRRWTEGELVRMTEICLANDIKIISDEIHCDLLRQGYKHTPLAKLFPETLDIITCMAVSKTFNLAGMMIANIIIPDPVLRERWNDLHYPFINPVSLAAAIGAYRDGEAWLEDLRTYLDGNFVLLDNYVRKYLPEARFVIPEATYLAWLDVRAYFPESVNLTRFFLERAGVIFEGGEMFVDNGDGCVRLNLACPRSVLQDALDRMRTAIQGISLPPE
ncbi:putative C-S lyase [Pseudomonas syringae]|uniref:MalY/PatB family protein n=1 Tax=Pseudomonas ovata TaxID=1839709 RepID=UPI000D69F6AF|nr:PatB family C-S lyase [Pseudomonas ovata]MBD8577538.1 putative C-S lyase [Pseudomonas syringae]